MLDLNGWGTLLGGEPFLYAGAPVKNFPTHKRAGRPHAKHVPTVERARASPQFDGEFFLRQKFCKDRFRAGHVISYKLATIRLRGRLRLSEWRRLCCSCW